MSPSPTLSSAPQVYVIKLHRDAGPDGRLQGRAIHLESGAALRFDDGAVLVEWLLRHAPSSTKGAG
jgi:hypothetical protein